MGLRCRSIERLIRSQVGPIPESIGALINGLNRGSIIVKKLLGLAASVLTLIALALVIPAQANVPADCNNNQTVVTLSDGDNTWDHAGSNTPYCVDAMKGDDNLHSGDANDRIEAGPGEDWISTNDGADDIYGGGGTDQVYAGAGCDFIDVGPTTSSSLSIIHDGPNPGGCGDVIDMANGDYDHLFECSTNSGKDAISKDNQDDVTVSSGYC